MMTYDETIEKIHSFLKFGSKLGLERMNKLMDLLGNPQNRIKTIHVGGTNGKGSVCRYLYTILQENGYRTGLFTSPYLERFTERIEYNGEEISPGDLIKYTELALEKVEVMLAEGYDSPTEFELITAIGFLYFADKDVDYLLLEVGLGGFGDSTNVVERPLVSVITSVSFDHMEYLGDTLEKIAVQKAGILKKGVPVVYHVADRSASEAIDRLAAKKECAIYKASDVKTEIIKKSLDGYIFNAKILGVDYTHVSIGMIGGHQMDNAVCALMVIEILKQGGQIKVEKEKIYSALKRARQPGRLEVLKRDPYVIIDGAHNAAGADALAATIKDHFAKGNLLMVIGMLADKEIDPIIEKFGSIAEEFIATEPDNPRKLPADQLANRVVSKGKTCIAVSDIQEACRYAMSRANAYDAVIFAGSLYLIGRVRGILR